jgi:hypothetical protein
MMLAETAPNLLCLKLNLLIETKVFNPAAFQKLQYTTYQGIKETQDPIYNP